MKSALTQLLLIFFPFLLLADNIEGTLVDQSRTPVVGAYIIHLQSEHHAHSNENGKFFMNDVQIGDTLQIIHLGYKTLLYEVKNTDKPLTIVLTESVFELGEIVVGQNIKKINIISAIDVQTSPINSSQEMLRKVPGLFIGQHAGGGKAEQIFLRGFDIDHGTDINISVDGIPVNMVSNAHGQGYADMHFIIPETIANMNFGKGPYYADKGNFTTAGYVQFKTKDKIDNSQISLEYGRFNTVRNVGLFNIINTENHKAYIATDFAISDGAFESSQNFSRNNFFAKYTANLNKNDRISVLASHFTSKWDASGQIPQRAVDQGLITRFGAIDDTEGGETSRSNVAINFSKTLNETTFVKNNIYYSLYDFELFSNFTFFLDDPINGDQIKQFEQRQIFGFESVWNKSTYFGDVSTLIQLGGGLRADKIEDNELSRTLNRRTLLERIQYGDVDEKNYYSFLNTEFDIGNLLIQPGLRVDFFKFNYVDRLATLYQRLSQTKAIVSPKFNVVYNLNNSAQLFFKSGVGFHSNDARVVLREGTESILPPAYGLDIGTILKPSRRVIANIALWYLFLEQEFVYVGDAGIVEPSGRTRRLGVDFVLRYQLSDWLFANGDVNYAFARSIDEPENANYIPLAPMITASAGLNMKRKDITANLQVRYLKDRPANEDNSIIARGYMITDMNASYNYKNMSFGFSIENLFNQEWNETQFATESRLAFEDQSVEEIHFTPGTPFFLKGIFKYRF